MSKIAQIYEEFKDGSKDPHGTTISVKKIKTKDQQRALNIYMVEGGDTRQRMVGQFIEVGDEVIYYKVENEKDIHRNTFSWTMLKFVVPYVDKVVYETNFAKYTATHQKIEREGFYASYKTNNRGLMAKLFLRIEDWTIEARDPKDQKRIELLGYEWYRVLKPEFQSAYMQELGTSLVNLRKRSVVYPDNNEIFNAYKFTPYNNVKVVILGQDPYHDGSAHGLAFSIKRNQFKVPPSLQNILKEMENDFADGFYLNADTNLEHWAKQGVFLLNTVLTVEKGHPASHSKLGWQRFTKATLARLLERQNSAHRPMVFMLWGKHAQSYESMIDHEKHLVLKAAHPSPFSAHKGFMGCKHFSKCNEFLERTNQNPIIW